MKKIVMVLLVAALAVSIPTGLALAKTEVKNIEFNTAANNLGWWQTRPQASSSVTNHRCDFHLEGSLRERGDLKYLSPLTGTIYNKQTEVEYNIQVKPVDESEPIYHWTVTGDTWRAYVVANIEGREAVGILYWNNQGKAWLYVDGVVDGNLVSIWFESATVTID